MRKIIYQFFLLGKGERRALVVIIFFLLLVITVRVYIAKIPYSMEYEKDETFMLAMQKLKRDIIAEENRKNHHPVALERNDLPPAKLKLKPFRFDPNIISLDGLLQMNLPEFVARNLIAYREAGAVFEKPEDVKKIYGLNPNVYEKILPFIQIDLPTIEKTKTTVKKKAQKTAEAYVDISFAPMELNDCDSIELQLVPGIGPVFASRIVKYRLMLGGYHHFDQLWEVYGMDSSKYRSIKEYCILDTSMICKLDLEKASFRQLISHPYIDRNTTHALMQFRAFSDSIQYFDDLINNQVFDYENIDKIRPYLQLK